MGEIANLLATSLRHALHPLGQHPELTCCFLVFVKTNESSAAHVRHKPVNSVDVSLLL